MYCIVDIETNGGSSSTGKITEIAILHFNGYEVTDKFVTLLNPQAPIPPFIQHLTGINPAMVATAPLFAEVAEQILHFTMDRIFIAHNVSFDYNFVRHEFARLGMAFERKKICTVQLSRKLMPGLPSYSLGKLCQQMKINILNRHRAEGDAQATALLMRHLLHLSHQQQISIF